MQADEIFVVLIVVVFVGVIAATAVHSRRRKE
jgi:hypothetical protein